MKNFVKRPRYFRIIIPVFLAISIPSIAFAPPNTPLEESLTQTYRYDSAGRLTQVEFGDGHIIQYTYDANGNILSVELSKPNKIFSDGFEALAFLNPLRLWQ